MMGGSSTKASSAEDKQDIAALRFALDNGINVIDTAEMYANGHSEEVVGQAINGYDREELFIITKVLPRHLKYDDLIKAARGSLARLGCGYIDLYLIHWLIRGSNVEEAISAMEYLVDEGLVGHIGVSNFEVPDMTRAIAAAKKQKIIANEIEYNLFEKSPEKEIIPFCEKNKIVPIAYTPLSKGTLGRGRIEDIEEVKAMAKRTGKTPVQIALSYLAKRSLPIPKSSNIEHIKEIIGAMGWELSNEDYELLKSI